MLGNTLTKDVKPFSRDRLSLVSRDSCAEGAMKCLDQIQNATPEQQVGAVSVLFAAWCKRLRLDPHAMYQLGVKMIDPEFGHQKANLHLETLRDFAGIRLAGDPNVDVR